MYFINMLITALIPVLLAFLIFLVSRPKIEIAKCIAKQKDESGNDFYKFKFINKSLFVAYDVRLELSVITEEEAQANQEGVNVNSKTINLTKHRYLYLDRKNFRQKRYADNCFTTRVVNHNVEEVLKKPNSYLVLRIIARHGFSNLNRVFHVKYKTAQCIREGNFVFGDKIEII